MVIIGKLIIFALISMLISKMAETMKREEEIGQKRKWEMLKNMEEAEYFDLFETQQARMANLLETGQAFDIQFKVGNEATGKKLFKAHTFVLGIGKIISPKFEAQIRTNESTNWPKDEPIEVVDIEPSAFQAMLNYLYLGDLSKITKENIANVFDAAKKYLLQSLVEKCIYFAMTTMLDVHNVLDVMDAAKLHGEMLLVEHCLSFIDENITEFVETDEFLALNRKEIAEIFARNTLNSEELPLFQALDRWAQKQCFLNQKIEHPTGEEKRVALGMALKAIRFPLINSTDFIKKIVPTGILEKNIQNALLHNFKQTNAKDYFEVPFSSEERKIPRNNKFNRQYCSPKLAISGNGLVLTHSGPDGEPNSAHAIYPVPLFSLKKTKNSYIAAYFEVLILREASHSIRIGFCNGQFQMEGNSLGNRYNSFGIYAGGEMHIEAKHIKFENGRGNFVKGDVIGIGLLHSPANSKLQCFATCNGTKIGLFDLAAKFLDMELFAAIGLYHAGDSIKANFGKEKWLYNPFK